GGQMIRERHTMSFLFNHDRVPQPPASPAPEAAAKPALNGAARAQPDAEKFYRELIERRPALLDVKLKLHARIIDEFNLALLEKLANEELVRQVRDYVTNYVRTEKISLNQKELELFTDEIIHEMTGLGPIEPLLKDPTVN